MPEEKELTNGGQIFVPITNKDVYLKVLDLEREIAALKVRVYTVFGVLTMVGALAGLLGGLVGR